MNHFMELSSEELEHIRGGFPWATVTSVISLVQKEAPDFMRGWKDYQRGTFLPPN